MRESVHLKTYERGDVGTWKRESREGARLFGWRFTSDGLRQDVKRDLTAFNPPSRETWVSTCIRVVEQLAFGESVVGRFDETERMT